MTKINYTLDLGKYNLVELECFLAEGVISVTEFEQEQVKRNLTHDTVTPPDGRV